MEADVSVSDWASIAGAGAALVGAVLTAVIAWIAHRFAVDTHRRGEVESIRALHSAWSDELENWIHDSQKSGPVRPLPRSEPPVVSKLKATDHDTRCLEARIDVLNGHLKCAEMLSDLDHHWVRALDEEDESVEEVVIGIVNGVLDVVKDNVLTWREDLVDDHDFLRKGFWVELDAPGMLRGEPSPMHIGDDDMGALSTAAARRWIMPGASADSLVRLHELVRYKIFLERALAQFFVGSFTNWNQDGSASNGEKFRIAMRALTPELRSSIDRQLEADIEKTASR